MARLHTATRTLTNRGQLRAIGAFYSVKNRCGVPWESQVERDLFYDAEYDRRVVSYRPQPRRLDGWCRGVKFTYTPDAEVVLSTGEIVYREAKAVAPAPDSDLAAKLAAADETLRQEGSCLEVVLAADLRRGFRMPNIRTLYRYARETVSEAALAHIDAVLSPRWSPLAGVLSAMDRTLMPALWRLMFEQFIEADLESHLLGDATLVRRRTA